MKAFFFIVLLACAICADPAKVVYDHFYKFFKNAYAASAMVGCIKAESNLNPKAIDMLWAKKHNYTADKYTKDVDKKVYKNFATDKVGYGLLQWTVPARKANLYTFAKGKPSIGAMDVQLNFIDKELTGFKAVITKLINAKSLKVAFDDLNNGYIRNKVGAKMAEKFANEIYNKYGKSTVTPPTNDPKPIKYDGNAAKISTKFADCGVQKAKFVEVVKSMCNGSSSYKLYKDLCDAEAVWSASEKAGVNPALVIVRAINEGCSPGNKDGSHNYWGIAVFNGQSSGAKYKSLEEGIAGFAGVVVKKGTVGEMMKTYAYIGDYWYNPGSWGDGGCKYYPYIKEFMSATRSAEVAKICAGSACSVKDKSHSGCTKTVAEDQAAYCAYNVNKNMGKIFKLFF